MAHGACRRARLSPRSRRSRPRCSQRLSRCRVGVQRGRRASREGRSRRRPTTTSRPSSTGCAASSADTPEVLAVSQFIHFACTSEDINNLCHALMLEDSRAAVLLPALDARGRQARPTSRTLTPICRCCRARTARPPRRPRSARKWRTSCTACGARGSASPPWRLTAKINGAVGNYNAHLAAYPDVDWEAFARRFVECFGLAFNRLHHPDRTARQPGGTVRRLCGGQHHPARPRPRHVGLYLAGLLPAAREGRRGRLLDHAAQGQPDRLRELRGQPRHRQRAAASPAASKLPVSRWQRDLSDSTALRNIGVALGHTLLAFDACLRGLGKVEADPARLRAGPGFAPGRCWPSRSRR